MVTIFWEDGSRKSFTVHFILIAFYYYHVNPTPAISVEIIAQLLEAIPFFIKYSTLSGFAIA